MSGENDRGRFVWHDLMTLDVPRAISFYTKVVGWKFERWDAMPGYTLVVAAAGPVGGVMVLPEAAKAMGAPPHWLTYIGTPDADATARQAEELGATVLVPPGDLPNGGRFAILQDPLGATFAIYRAEPGAPPHKDVAPKEGEFSWHELATTNLEAGFEFYRQLFGWEKMTAMDMGEMGIYQMYGWGGVPKGGMYRKPANMPAPPHWMPYATVPDAKKTAAVIASAKGMILYGPTEVPGGDWITMALDPQGAAFAVHSLAATTGKMLTAKAAAKKVAAKPAKKKAAKQAARRAPRKSAKKSAKRVTRKAGKKPAGRKRVAKKPGRRPKRAPARKSSAGKRASRGRRR